MGKVLIPPTCSIKAYQYKVYYVPNKYCGFFVRRLDTPEDWQQRGKTKICEAYAKTGNLIITLSRNYGHIRFTKDSEDLRSKYIIIENVSGIGLCDFNGYELAAPIYSSYSYDGYDFEGIIKESGRKVTKTIHKRPTPTQTQAINNWAGYYANMPWLMMPGPQYTPTFNINWDNWDKIDWSTVNVYGGMGDYVAPDMNLNDNSGSSYSSNSSNNGGGISSHKCAYCNGTGKK